MGLGEEVNKQLTGCLWEGKGEEFRESRDGGVWTVLGRVGCWGAVGAVASSLLRSLHWVFWHQFNSHSSDLSQATERVRPKTCDENVHN